MAKERDFVRTIEATYDVEGSVSAWLTNVLEAARPWYEAGAGLWGCSWQVTPAGHVTFDDFVNVGGPPVSLIDLGRAMPPEIASRAAQIHLADFIGLNSDVEPEECRRYFMAPLRPFGITDIHMINGRDVAERGVCIGSHIKRSAARRRTDPCLLARLARHMVAGSRLRARLEGRAPADEDAAAILSSSGKLEHATPVASVAEARAALRDAVLAMDRARGAERRRDPDSAVRRWRVLADARFTLIDRFESDGRRYVVACENAPARTGPARLTARDRQVVALYRLGADAKLIAYELGLAHATVRVLLSRAARRVGVATPRALRSVDWG